MKTARTLFLFLLIAGGALQLCTGADDAAQKEIALLQGSWSMISGSADAQDMPPSMLKGMKRACVGDELTVTMSGQVFFKAKIKVDPSKNPKTIDYEMTEGVTKGKRQLGIYEIDGDTFKSSFAKPDAERPADFKPAEGRTVSVWKRDQK
jgi:uncharacterized protein (TIGR03067 family)